MLKIFPWGEGQKLFGGKSRFAGKTQSIYSVAKNSLMGKTLVIVVKGKKKKKLRVGSQPGTTSYGWREWRGRKKKKNNKQSTLNRSQIKKTKKLSSLHRVQMHDRLSGNN